MNEKNTHNTAETFGESKLFCAYLLKVGKSSISPVNKGNNKIIELRTILQRESQNS